MFELTTGQSQARVEWLPNTCLHCICLIFEPSRVFVGLKVILIFH